MRKVDAEAAAEYGAAYPMGARMMSGHTTMHEELEKRLAKFCSQRSLLFAQLWLPRDGFYHRCFGNKK